MSKVDMVHLHMHSTFSALDCISKIPDIVKRLGEHGAKAAHLSDHGTLAGTIEWHEQCTKAGIKPLMGFEAYMIPDDKVHRQLVKDKLVGTGKRNYHLILIAMSQKGWRNINILNTKANEKFYYDPRVDYHDLEAYNEDVIAITACLKGIVPYHLSIDDFSTAAEHAKKLQNIFGDRFYLETQDGGLDIQPKVNNAMRALGKQLGIPIVGCQDAHYVNREDVEAHEAIWAIRSASTLDEPTTDKGGNRIYYATKEYFLKSGEEMLFEDLTTENGEKRRSTVTQEELERTLEVAERCKPIKLDDKMHLPKYTYIPDILSGGCATANSCNEHNHDDNKSLSYLSQLVKDGYEQIYGPWKDAPQEHKDRIAKEMGDIEKAQLADYFLIVWDIINWARKNSIPVGPSRGSAGGSVVSYCLKITEICPFKYGLIWERFYNAGRVGSLADIDMDFSKKRRKDVIKYIQQRFGEKRVAQMVTFNALKTKAAIKDTAKLLGKSGLDFESANAMTKHVPFKSKTLKQALEESEDLKKDKEKNPRLFAIADKLEGCIKSRGKHAAGIIIADEDLDCGSISLCWDTKEKQLITEFDGVTLEKLKYLKMDVLGISTLDVLRDVESHVNGIQEDNKKTKKDKK